jgi:hypothetical protein
MNDLGTPFAKLHRQLRELVAEAAWPSPETAFADYVLKAYGDAIPRRPLVKDRLGEAPMLATAGYQYVGNAFERSASYDDEWALHFERLASRNAFPVDRESYFYRPLELIGLCFGAYDCPAVDSAHREWLSKIMEEGRERLQAGMHSHFLTAFAASCLGVRWTVLTPQTDQCSLSTLCLLHWLATEVEFLKLTGLDLKPQSLEARILNLALSEENQVNDVAEAALVLCVTRCVLDATIQSQVEQSWAKPVNSRDALRVVENICDRYPIAVNALQSRHDNRTTITMTDEYDVQDLLGALLKLHFEDVRPEEWTPGYAGHSSRIDFVLKAFGIVVEVKMTRKNLGQKEVVNQLAIDILRYQAYPDCKTLLCFVYDPDGYCKNPTVLQNDLTKKHGAIDVVVMVRPLLK